MATDQTPPGAARIVKTKRLQYVVQAADVTATVIDVDVPWDTPFVDLNYSASVSVEAVAPALAKNYFVGGFSRDVNKLTVSLEVSGAADDVVILHAHAVRD